MGAVDERLARIEARLELSDLVGRYCRLVDGRDYAGVAALFAADASFHYPGGSAARADLEEFFAGQLTQYEATYHYTHAHLVELAGDDAASGSVDAHAEHAVDGACVVAGIRYEDEYVRDAGEWRFGRRTLQIRYFLPVDKLGTAYRHSSRFPRPTA
jgi:hypothetical protein